MAPAQAGACSTVRHFIIKFNRVIRTLHCCNIRNPSSTHIEDIEVQDHCTSIQPLVVQDPQKSSLLFMQSIKERTLKDWVIKEKESFLHCRSTFKSTKKRESNWQGHATSLSALLFMDSPLVNSSRLQLSNLHVTIFCYIDVNLNTLHKIVSFPGISSMIHWS